MIFVILRWATGVAHRCLYRRWDRITRRLYPDLEDRALALIAEGMELHEVIATGAGEVIRRFVVEADEDEGYVVHVTTASDEAE